SGHCRPRRPAACMRSGPRRPARRVPFPVPPTTCAFAYFVLLFQRAPSLPFRTPKKQWKSRFAGHRRAPTCSPPRAGGITAADLLLLGKEAPCSCSHPAGADNSRHSAYLPPSASSPPVATTATFPPHRRRRQPPAAPLSAISSFAFGTSRISSTIKTTTAPPPATRSTTASTPIAPTCCSSRSPS